MNESDQKGKNFSKEYYPVVVYFENLEELYDAFKQRGGEVEMSTDRVGTKGVGAALA